MKVVRGILITLVGVIILLHTLVPHQHLKTASKATLMPEKNKVDLFRNIQISFGLDHGNGHFEHFIDSGDDNVDSIFPGYLSSVDAYFIFDSLISNQPGVSYPERSTIATPLRGPPVG